MRRRAPRSSELVEGGAGRREQHDRLRRRRTRRRRPPRPRHGLRQRAAARRRARGRSSVAAKASLACRSGRPCATRAKSGASGAMPPSFGMPPTIQWMRAGKAASAFSAASALVALLSLTNSTRPIAADLLHAVGEARESSRGPRGSLGLDAERARRGDGRRGVLRIVRAAQRADAGEVERRSRCRRRRQHDARAVARRSPSASVPLDGDADDACVLPPASRSAIARHQSSSTPTTAVSAAGDQPLLDGGVVLHRAVPVEMVGRDVEQDADASAPATARGRSGRTSTRRRGRGSATAAPATGSAVPILPPICTSRPAALQHVGDQRRRRRLAVGAGDGDERRARRTAPRARGRTARCRR